MLCFSPVMHTTPPSITPQEHRRIRGEYEARLRELEAERHLVEEDLAQVDR
jgi:hypothetical protein